MNESEKFVGLPRIRKQYRDMLKQYCKNNGNKMYVLIEQLIEQQCKSPSKTGARLIVSTKQS